jgi:hypothetical protein
LYYSGEPEWQEQLRLAAPAALQIKADTYESLATTAELEELSTEG